MKQDLPPISEKQESHTLSSHQKDLSGQKLKNQMLSKNQIRALFLEQDIKLSSSKVDDSCRVDTNEEDIDATPLNAKQHTRNVLIVGPIS